MRRRAEEGYKKFRILVVGWWDGGMGIARPLLILKCVDLPREWGPPDPNSVEEEDLGVFGGNQSGALFTFFRGVVSDLWGKLKWLEVRTGSALFFFFFLGKIEQTILVVNGWWAEKAAVVLPFWVGWLAVCWKCFLGLVVEIGMG